MQVQVWEALVSEELVLGVLAWEALLWATVWVVVWATVWVVPVWVVPASAPLV